jgi:UDP-N-acetylglucosamine--N-acetylmuramyl-(pentapeptide) pyrophosphoryl-undecaprenol N-acetylglucosamine transferase
MWYLNKAIGEAKKLINELNPAVIISTGGFAAGATGLAAGMTRTPLVIIEPNAYPGLTNKKLGPAAEMIFISYDSAREFFPVDKTFNYGVPTRKALFEIDRNEARQKLGIAEDTVMVLATGGSQGADSININLPFGILQMVRDFEDIDIKVFHQAGKGRIDEARIFREEMDDDMYEVVEFIEDMPTHLAAADIVVSRAGASTLAEISAVGVASIIFPFPKAAENHQYKNAKEWEDAGATILLTDGSTNIGDMTASLSRLFYDRSVRDEMAAASRKFSHPDSAKNIADKLDKFLG